MAWLYAPSSAIAGLRNLDAQDPHAQAWHPGTQRPVGAAAAQASQPALQHRTTPSMGKASEGACPLDM
jgi:hypothetical protein